MMSLINARLMAVMLGVLVIAANAACGENNNARGEANSFNGRFNAEYLNSTPPSFHQQFMPRHQAPNHMPKSPGLYTKQDWAEIIDSTWGVGLSGYEKASLFIQFWMAVDQNHAAFHAVDTAIWDSIFNLYWPVEYGGTMDYDTVSRGQFCALMQYSAMQLKDQHTYAQDNFVVSTWPDPGIPLIFVGGWGYEWHFGAGLTPMPDSSLLVYKAVDPHPLGLTPGDIILGYDGIPWKELYPLLQEAQLPKTGWWWGSHDSSNTHAWLISAGLNWHLFDTIDIVQYSSGDTLHLPTSLMVGFYPSLWITEQLEVPGVPFPDIYSNETISYGLIDGTSIAYMYCIGFYDETSGEQWISAIHDIMNNYTTTGLIIDERTNYGGWIAEFPPFNYIFNATIEVEDWDARCPMGNRLQLCPYDFGVWNGFGSISGDPGTYYDKPIAVLTGPGAVSLGDQLPLYLSFHANAKLFGKPTTGDYTGISQQAQFEFHPDWSFGIANVNSYVIGDSGDYLMGKVFPNDADNFPWVNYESVWLTQEGVSQNRDDVVEAAFNWIIGHDIDQDGVANESDNCLDDYNPDQEDMDSDSIGDSCDNCIDVYNPDQVDLNLNDIGDACEFTCGDADDNEAINILDITFLINYLYKGGPEPESIWAADPSGDSVINILDITYLINYLYKGGPVPQCSPA